MTDIKDLLPSDEEGRLRIIQEQVPGNQISLAHIIGGPQPIIYQKLGLNPDIDYDGAAIGIMTMIPYETSVIAADIATKSSDIYLGFVDRSWFCGPFFRYADYYRRACRSGNSGAGYRDLFP